MSKNDSTDVKDTKAAAATQSRQGYVSSGFEKRREFRELISGKVAVKDHFVATTIKRVEDRNKLAG
jgi:hypothetical protein